MKPGIYSEYTSDLVRKSQRHHSYSYHSLLGFNPIPLACVVIRILLVAIWDLVELIREDEIDLSLGWLTVLLALGWAALVGAKVLLGACIRVTAELYSSFKAQKYRRAPGGQR